MSNLVQKIRGPCVEVMVNDGCVRYGKKVMEHGNMPLHEAIQRADDERRVFVSNAKLDRIINPDNDRIAGKEAWQRISRLSFEWFTLTHAESHVRSVHAFPLVSTGTLTAHQAYGEELGKAVEYENGYGIIYVFPVPAGHEKDKNALLVVEHPDYTFRAGGQDRFVVVAKDVDVLQGLPEGYGGGMFIPDPVHGIPIGERYAETPAMPSMRNMFKSQHAHIGLVVRTVCRQESDNFMVMLFWPGVDPCIAIEAPEMPQA